ncbi:hypothetical protein AB7102_14490 [Providencia manganoxydans]|uniref:hypothetical protein n=1 Tax=Providencia manganoxydans TaxID=2923283 RepID=UPI0034E59E42
MKDKLLNILICIVFSMTLLIGVVSGNESFLNIGVSIAWVIIPLCLIASLLIFLICIIFPFIDDPTMKHRVIVLLLEITKPKRFKWMFLINDIVAITCLVISGWIFTAVSVFLIKMLIKLMCKMALETLELLNNESA